MIVTYRPADGDAQTWDYKPTDLSSKDAEDIEEASGLLFDDWQVKLLQGGLKARRALLWIFLRRETPNLRFHEVSFQVGELLIEWDASEKAIVRAEVEKSTDLSDDDRRRVLDILSEDGDAEVPKDSTDGHTVSVG